MNSKDEMRKLINLMENAIVDEAGPRAGQVFLGTYRVQRGHDLLDYLLQVPGLEVEMDDDDQGATLTIDGNAHPASKAILAGLARVGMAKAVAGPVTK